MLKAEVLDLILKVSIKVEVEGAMLALNLKIPGISSIPVVNWALRSFLEFVFRDQMEKGRNWTYNKLVDNYKAKSVEGAKHAADELNDAKSEAERKAAQAKLIDEARRVGKFTRI